jgi:DNA repair protein SbcC/Rad50
VRPVLLRVEGFTCFKREQLVDFHGLDLFAISGQTGAGKSSILDAMVYALYGRIPRIGKRGYTEFISLGASRMSVRFDFTVGEQRYRVTRTARRAGTATAQIEELRADGETLRASLADGVANVDRVVVEIVGLEYEGFIQAVVLPQGDFAKFLKSPAGDRTKLLRELLRLGRYEDMRQLAQTKSKAAEGEGAHIEKRLAEDYGGATPAEVGRLEGKTTEDGQALGVIRKMLQASELEVKDARRLREKTAELEAKEREKRELSDKEGAVSRTREQLEAAARAVKVAPLLIKVHEEETREERVKGEVADAEEAFRSAASHEKKSLVRHAKAKDAGKKIPALEKTIQQLGEVIGLIEPKKRAEQGVRRLEEHGSAWMLW